MLKDFDFFTYDFFFAELSVGLINFLSGSNSPKRSRLATCAKIKSAGMPLEKNNKAILFFVQRFNRRFGGSQRPKNKTKKKLLSFEQD